MKRSLILCAIALVAVVTSSARADIDIQLNLQYTDPNDVTAGGTWELLVESTDTDGVVGITAVLDNIDLPGSGAGEPTAAGTTGWNVFQSQFDGTAVEIVAGSNLAAAAVDVGLAGGTGVGVDDLFTSGSPWTHSSLVAVGEFGAITPTFTTIASLSATTAGNTITSGGVVNTPGATINRMLVRGDDGLLPGDANRDGAVTISDLSILGANFGNAAATWDLGNFNSAGGTTISDLSLLGANFGGSVGAPAISAVPEPASVMLLGLGLLGFASRRRRS